jgi:hypothetical protein
MDTAKQMEMAFMQEGGITDDGMNVDPVSGNEVPPGSLAKEVRDDIPAQLSEGEYVVPADVVRYYGVKFFEDLRSEAKMGLGEMEQNGRIGGEPVPMGGPQMGGDLTPEELAVLQEMGMAVGGMVPQQMPPQAIGNTVEMAQGGAVRGYAPGGDTAQPETDPYQAQSTAQSLMDTFSPGFLAQRGIERAQQQQQQEEVQTIEMLYGPNGEVVALSLPQDQKRYEELLAEGYTTEMPTLEPGQSEEQGDRTSVSRPQPEVNVEDIESKDLEKTAKGLSTMTNIATALASTVGLPVSAFINTQAVARYNDILDRMAAEGIETDLERRGSIFGGEGGIYENLKDSDGSGGASFGDTWLGDLLGFDGEAGIAEGNPGLRDSWGGARRTSDSDSGTTTTTSTSGSGSSGGSSSAPASSPRPQSRPDSVGSTVDTTDNARSNRTNTSTVGTRASESYKSQEDAETGLLNKGGMVKRRRKKKK